MIDPLAEVVTLLQPRIRFSKVVSSAGPWRVRRSHEGQPFYCVVLEGASLLTTEGREPLSLRQGDFVLIPESHAFSMSSLKPPPAAALDAAPQALPNGEFRFGPPDSPTEAVLLIGHCAFDSPDAALLVSLLPRLIHVRGEQRLSTLVQLVGEESRARRPGREVVLAHLLEVLLIEALRSSAVTAATPGLLRGLADERLALALRRMHEQMTAPWTVAQLAKEAALSRSAFFERFSRAVGVAPMEYLLRWRMAKAKNLLRRREGNVAAVAERVGYGSASAFSVAFTRHVGMSPTRYALTPPPAPPA
ncbi:helix-turn-helix domain-containing protein [Pseudoduganella sp. FT25W]|uniref:Helix-turn-helix domain-containing protein n=1 Tax=Duganella alba TaxID=2666081 RepID=A0A6L5QMM6_9BURK|nr:AraC family transcriptional regulator [Duganella alba]MRX11074.1 helix-turn-helix domain-containing protein [Duganella alba]MRX15291.1 helix-turn-helix domain-containing protein [Duganella alba]